MDKQTLFVALNALPGMTPRLFWRLVRSPGDPARLFSAAVPELVSMGVSARTAEALRECDPGAVAQREFREISRLGGGILIHGAVDYPAGLLEIADPPPVLYVLGELRKEDTIALAIVGSRAASTRGRLHAERIAADLAGRGMTIVSGLAMGIDTWAHKGALAAGGRTLAVLGCGLDVSYPKYNEALRKGIREQGALISEFPLGTPPLPMHFPRRNRIISGISLGTLVVEAAKRSGSLITARLALDQGRDVFAIPGNIHAALSAGVNALIQKGAKLVQGVEDIVEEFSPEVRACLQAPPRPKTESRPPADRGEALILKLIHKEPIHIDELTRTTSLAPEAVSSALMKLELQGRVRRLPGQLYTRP